MSTAHLISGLPGAGKSTYAQQLQLRTGAVVFTLDRFLITMFGRYEVPDVGGGEHVRRVFACREVIWMSAEKLLVHGSDVILDDGYLLREHRRKVVDAAVTLGAEAKIHFIDTPLDEIRKRLADRNQNLPVSNFAIEPETLEGCVRLFETPSDADAAEIIVIQGGREAPDKAIHRFPAVDIGDSDRFVEKELRSALLEAPFVPPKHPPVTAPPAGVRP